MSEQNGNGESGGSFVDQVRAALGRQDENLLRDLSPDFPALRTFLLGRKTSSDVQPAGTISISRHHRGIRVCLRIPQLSVEALFEFSKWSDMWDTLEQELSQDTVPWQLDYKQRQKEQLAYLKTLRE